MKLLFPKLLTVVSMVFFSGSSTAAELTTWNNQTLYAQEQATDNFADSVLFSVDQPGYVGVAVAFRTWEFTGSTIGQFWATLTNVSTGAVNIETNDNYLIPNVGGTYFLDPMFLSSGEYLATVSFQLPGSGTVEIDVVSNQAPYASLSPITSVPLPASIHAMLAALAPLFAIGLPRHS